jgi:hypothetical protein
MASKVSANSLSSSRGPVRAIRSFNVDSDNRRAVAVIWFSGLRTRPASHHPMATDRIVSTRMVIPETTHWKSSTAVCRSLAARPAIENWPTGGGCATPVGSPPPGPTDGGVDPIIVTFCFSIAFSSRLTTNNRIVEVIRNSEL